MVEHIVNLHVERLPQGCHLATSDEAPGLGLVAEGRTPAIICPQEHCFHLSYLAYETWGAG